MTIFAGDTLVDLFRAAVADRGDDVALSGPDSIMSWRQYGGHVDALADQLRSTGLTHGERVGLLMGNRPEFHVADMAVLVAGGVPFSIEPGDAEAKLDSVMRVAAPRILLADASSVDTARMLASAAGGVRVISSTEFAQPTEGFAPNSFAPPDSEDIATLIFTSGTTGEPKAVQLAHRVMVSSLRGTDKVAPMATGGRVLSYLPLTHIAERFMSYYFAVATGSTIHCVPDADLLYDELRRVRPTRFFAVPRVYEKLRARGRALQDADETVTGRQIMAEFGLDASEYRGVATAPASEDLLGYFAELGSPVSNIWGMSEAIMCTVNPPERLVSGSVGVFLDSCEGVVAPDGELLVRGSNVMSGYLGDPIRTREVVDDDGWLHTGDLGRIDTDGYVFILGRKKDLLVTATGRNIVPTRIEQEVRSRSDLVSAVMAIAEGRRHVTLLMVPDESNLRAFANEHGVEGTIPELTADPVVVAELDRLVRETNKVLDKAETIRNWILMSEEWSPGSDELTSTMKIRRAAVERKYAAEIDQMYSQQS
ncbi:AMP-dependent synthetase/ligase [Gordonia rhizosphera]|uniref:Acyl-CoA synthetase n=1 Tax=Gordonia rhizosphera NBRC 16068 TaxID=1108045 RepID=K6W7W7_9ACTN|nr:AMP-dependent synthetase/ligase [Gordonia rhizosphera]GAB89806.1 putative fatty-acid--CoA ligase [Gordonia rhizosphera NBRC 16068]